MQPNQSQETATIVDDSDSRSCLGQYVESRLRDEPSHFLFLRDPCRLTEAMNSVHLRGATRSLVRFTDHLSVRDALEDFRDVDLERGDAPFVIVAIDEASDMGQVADLVHRADIVTVTPTDLLAHRMPEATWPSALDILRGADFWALADLLVEARRDWGDALTATTAFLFIAECGLGRSIRGELGAADAAELWDAVHDDAGREFLDRYPPIRLAVERTILSAAPADVKVTRDPDFAVFVWTLYFFRNYAPDSDLLVRQFFDEEAWQKFGGEDAAALAQAFQHLAAQEPLRIVGQLRMAERALVSDPQRERQFLALIGLDGDRRTHVASRIASEEKRSGYVTECALRVLIAHAASPDVTIPKSRLSKILRMVERGHVAVAYPRYFPRLRNTIALFKTVVELAGHLRECLSNGWDRNLGLLPIAAWMDRLFPQHLVPMRALCEEIRHAPDSVRSLTIGAPMELVEECTRILEQAERHFGALVQRNYVSWISRHDPPPVLAVDFLDAVFLPAWRRLEAAYKRPLAVVCLLHGVRWDEWLIVEKCFDEYLTKHRREARFPLLGLLPTTRPYNTASLILGRFPSLADSGTVSDLFADRLAAEGIVGVAPVSTPDLLMPSVRGGVVLANVALPETGARKTRSTHRSRERLLHEAANSLRTFLQQVPPKALVVVVSNGGTTEVVGRAVPVKKGAVQVEHRWVGLEHTNDESTLPSGIAYFNARAIHLPNPHVARCAFAPHGVWFDTEARSTSARFVCGGISLDEMMLPCAVYTPKRRSRQASTSIDGGG